MTCGKLETLWMEYLDGKLAVAQHAEVEAHLAGCQACAARREESQAISQMLGNWEAPAPSPWFDARLRQRIAAETVPRGLAGWLAVFSPSFPLSVAALLFLGALLIWSGGTNQVPQVMVTDVKMDELLHVVEEVELINNFEVLGELNKPAAEQRGQSQEKDRK